MEPASTSTTTPVGLFPPPPLAMPAGSQGTDVELGYKSNYERFVNPPPYQEQYPRDMLYPTIGADENRMRWGLIRKVYSILFIQLLLTVAIAGVVVFYRPLAHSLVKIPGLLIGLAFLPFICKSHHNYHHKQIDVIWRAVALCRFWIPVVFIDFASFRCVCDRAFSEELPCSRCEIGLYQSFQNVDILTV